ncbi:MAG TPA: hypothetical protein VL463_30805 [Kofleriaceae bacterium]|nr:hypothetical protein [Kofleriaceae bacterium]
MRPAWSLLYAAGMKLRTIVLVSLLAACGSKKEGPPADHGSGSASAAEAKPAKKPLTADFFGKAVAPPGALAPLKWNMPAADAAKAAPALFKMGDKPGYSLAEDPAIDGVSYGVEIDKDTKKISRLSVQLPAAGKDLVAKAWGAGKDAKDSIGKPRTFWFDPQAKWRAYAEQGFGDDVNLELRPYVPAAELLDSGLEANLGKTVADLRAKYPDTIVERSDAQAAADQKAVGDFAGKDLSKEVGAAKADVRLDFPPTEWGEFWTRIQTDWTDDGKLDDVWFDLPYEAYQPAKMEIYSLIEKKYGTGKPVKYLGEDALLFGTKAPWVIVTDDTIGKAWNVRLSSTKPD